MNFQTQPVIVFFCGLKVVCSFQSRRADGNLGKAFQRTTMMNYPAPLETSTNLKWLLWTPPMHRVTPTGSPAWFIEAFIPVSTNSSVFISRYWDKAPSFYSAYRRTKYQKEAHNNPPTHSRLLTSFIHWEDGGTGWINPLISPSRQFV